MQKLRPVLNKPEVQKSPINKHFSQGHCSNACQQQAVISLDNHPKSKATSTTEPYVAG
jgi:hypothetical protein